MMQKNLLLSLFRDGIDNQFPLNDSLIDFLHYTRGDHPYVHYSAPANLA